MWRHKKINLWNYGIWCHFQVKRPWKRVLAKNYLLIVIPSRNIKDESLILPHINLSNFWAGSKLKEPAPILKGLYGMLANFDLLYLHRELQFRANFWYESITQDPLKEYGIISHNFKKIIFVTSSLRYSIGDKTTESIGEAVVPLKYNCRYDW